MIVSASKPIGRDASHDTHRIGWMFLVETSKKVRASNKSVIRRGFCTLIFDGSKDEFTISRWGGRLLEGAANIPMYLVSGSNDLKRLESMLPSQEIARIARFKITGDKS